LNLRAALTACAALLIVVGGAASCSSAGDKSSPAAGLSTPPGRPIAECARAVTRADVSKTYWGMHITSPIGPGFPHAPIGSVNLTTSGLYWNQVETAPGRYDFTRLDEVVATSHAQGAQPMMVLGFTPIFHAEKPESPAAASTMPDIAAWRAWVTAVVTRYGDRLDYQVWPEPNIISNWAGTPQQMARLTAIAGSIIHDRAPDAVVVAPATTLRLAPQQDWMSQFWGSKVDGRPVADSVDAVAVDPFPLQDGTPEDSLTLLCQARSILKQHGVDLPVWTNEINYGVASGGVTGVKAYPDAQQAAYVGRTYVLQAALGVDRVYWLGWFSFPTLAVSMTRAGIAPSPAGRAYITVHGWLASAPRPLCRVQRRLYTCIVDKGRTVLRILWRDGGAKRVTAHERATQVEYLSGQRRPLEGGDVLRVGQSPIAIVEAAS
jgi:hypothetical protein